MATLKNWGNYPVIDGNLVTPADVTGTQQKIAAHNAVIARGMGRCYADSALQTTTLSTLKLNHFLSFDAQSGELVCESGVTFEEILRYFVPRGWFLPVTPGTKFVTVGGALASDIHGKHHHVRGTFSDHVHWFDLALATGEITRCSRTENTELFNLTCGGMGLTGVILRVSFTLFPIETSYIRQESYKARNLDEIMELFEKTAHWSNSVAWIDCLARGTKMGRSILMVGEHATRAELKTDTQRKNPLAIHKTGKLLVPFDFPAFVLNPLTVKAFNFLYYNKHPNRTVESIIHYDTFYYPLDVIHHWNRIYGKNGFTQYQFVIPKAQSREALIEIIGKIGQRNMGSFLTVLKLFGQQPENYLRFPFEGYTLALDFKINPRLWAFLDELDEIVLKYNGRLYLTKDGRMSPEMLRKSYPMADAFIQKLAQINPNAKLRSVQSERLHLHPNL